jgi:hypothetical protein
MESKRAGHMPLEDYTRFGTGIAVVDLIKNWNRYEENGQIE